MTTKSNWLKTAVVAAGVGLAAGAWAQDPAPQPAAEPAAQAAPAAEPAAQPAVAVANPLPKLPKDAVLPQSKKSPGPVTFKHGTHVNPEKGGDCTSCHPRQFKILAKGGATASGEPIKHKAMAKGQYCGACHDGTKSFNLEECDKCHASE